MAVPAAWASSSVTGAPDAPPAWPAPSAGEATVGGGLDGGRRRDGARVLPDLDGGPTAVRRPETNLCSRHTTGCAAMAPTCGVRLGVFELSGTSEPPVASCRSPHALPILMPAARASSAVRYNRYVSSRFSTTPREQRDAGTPVPCRQRSGPSGKESGTAWTFLKTHRPASGTCCCEACLPRGRASAARSLVPYLPVPA